MTWTLMCLIQFFFQLWNDKHRFELVEETLRNTLNDLNLNYVDLYLIHWPFATSVNTIFK